MENLNEKIVKILKEKNKTISFMESCTGGFLANSITNIAGASNILKVSLVTYSNEYKIKFGVAENTLNKYTVYSIETAKEMAYNVSKFANADFGVGVTGELANNIKEKNIVYYSIFDKNSNKYVNGKINVEPDDRNKMKEKIANEIMQYISNSI